MLGSIAQDSKRRERFVEVIAGCKKLNGTICVAIKNSENEIYRVTLFPNGTSTCRHQNGSTHEGCASRSHGCYHVQAVRKIASLFTENGYLAKHKAPKSMQYYYFDDEPAALDAYNVVNEASQVVVGAELDDVYAKLASTKKVSTAGALNGNRGFSFWR